MTTPAPSAHIPSFAPAPGRQAGGRPPTEENAGGVITVCTQKPLKVFKTHRFSVQTCDLLRQLAYHYGVSQTAVLELLVHERSKQVFA